MMYMGADGVYTHTVCYERDDQCLVCSAGVPVQASDEMTLEQVRVNLPQTGQQNQRLTNTPNKKHLDRSERTVGMQQQCSAQLQQECMCVSKLSPAESGQRSQTAANLLAVRMLQLA